MENKVVVYGASGHGKVVADLLKKSKLPIHIIDDAPKLKELLGEPIQKVCDFEFTIDTNLILAIGNNRVRQRLASSLGVNFVTLIHPTAILSDFISIGKGTVILAGAVVNPDTVIGNHCIVNTGAVVEHDCLIQDYVHLSPNVSLAGGITVGEGTQVGIGAVVIQGVKIGKWAIIGAGAVIIRDVPDYAVVVGNPGKIIKYTKNE